MRSLAPLAFIFILVFLIGVWSRVFKIVTLGWALALISIGIVGLLILFYLSNTNRPSHDEP